MKLLPTPTANEHTGPGHAAQGGKNLRTEIALLPTPTSSQGRNATSGRQDDAKFNAGTTLQDVAYTGEWGKYEPAIRRWEAMTRPAPPPSEPKDDGEGARLSPRFVEWMMGLPDGWVTDVDIMRSHQLKALGNGVVPQQAYVALTVLMEKVRW